MSGADLVRCRTQEELERELAEAREQQAVTAEILRVISGSPMDLQRAFTEIAASAARLCEANDAAIHQVDGDSLPLVAHHGPVLVPASLALTRGVVAGRAVLDRQTIQVADLQTETDEYPEGSDNARHLGFRTNLTVPLIRAGMAIGVISIRRTEARLFSDKQVALLKTFADQAVIAIENTRLFESEHARTKELRESLECRTATGDVLGIIAGSPKELQPVFDGIVATAQRLCEAYDASIVLRDGDRLKLKAHVGPIPMRAEWPFGNRGLVASRSVIDKKTVHVHDLAAPGGEFPEGREDALKLGHRSILAVPLVLKGEGIGTIIVRRFEVRPFNDRQVELLKTFADQAVIAIENTRLFEAEQASKRELQESLEYQTAISEVLAVISRSPSDLKPVLEAIVETAARLCQADKANIRRKEGDDYHTVASIGFTQAQRDFIEQTAVQLDRSTMAGRVALDLETVHIADVLEDRDLRTDVLSGINFRTGLGVPLLRTGELVGVLLLSREKHKPFSRRQIELVETFADQAVIAIENTRLFEAEQARTRQLQQALEYQTATSKVLELIGRSPGALEPVFQAMLEHATRLCDAKFGIVFEAVDGGFRALATRGAPKEFADYAAAVRAWGTFGDLVRAKRIVHIDDISARPIDEGREPNRVVATSLAGIRTIIVVPMLKDDDLIGALSIYRTEVRPFSDRQIALLTAFTQQAVIAIENTRLFEEAQARTRDLTEALEQQTATADVLKVISRSALDVQRVLNALVESAARLCDANDAVIYQLFGDSLRLVAHHGQIPLGGPVGQYAIPLVRGSIPGRVVIDRRTIHITDVLSEADQYPRSRSRALQHGWRTALAVPLLHASEAIGAIVIRRTEVRPFTERQIELVNTFADQAVIAIENSRLFEEVQARNSELKVALEQQTATSELLKVIGRSTFNPQPVFEALAENAINLCEAEHAFIFRFDGHVLRSVATHNIPPALKAFVEANPIQLGRGSGAGRAALERRTIQIEDIRTDPEFTYGATRVGPMRTLLAVPMLRGDELLGVIVITRPEVRSFSDDQSALMETFADQAVIAIENTRLFEEVQARTRELSEALEQQTATSDVLNVMSRSAFHLQPVLDTIVETASRLCEAEYAFIFRPIDGKHHVAASNNPPAAYVKYVSEHPIPPGRGSLIGRAALDRRTVHLPDCLADPEFTFREHQVVGKYRSMLAVPLLREGVPIGVIALLRTVVKPFTDKQIELVTTFADQAVIAIENVRLFEEIAQKSRELEIASQHKSQFVANMSHELRTPLAAILGYAELIQEGFYEPQGPKSLDALTRIRSNGKHLLGLINTVLDIAKIESGQFTLNMTEYAIESVVETVRAATESLAQNKRLTLTTSVDKSLPVGLGDEQRLTQVLLNLVGNAIKFTDAGEVSIAAGARNGRIAVSVTDTGPGIPLDQQDRIFEQFHQVDSSNTKAKGGTGLGLAIAKQIVEMHGGRIWVESTPGKGSTFQMELPVRP